MNYKSLSFLTAFLLCFTFCAAQPYTRFIDEVYTNVKVTHDVVYGSNIPFASNDPEDLKMDIYQPMGDTMQNRPVVILIHGGSFLKSFGATGLAPFGGRGDNWLVESCTQLARKGYVAIAMTHRLGWDPTLLKQEDRARSIMQAVWRAQQDFRACVRFLRKSAAENNPYKINPNHICGGGSSSGAYVSIHSQMIDKPQELNYDKFLDQNGKSFLDTLLLGNFDGIKANNNKGSSLSPDYLSYSHKIPVLLSFGGAVGDIRLLEPGDPVVIAGHGVNDNTTPYGTATVFTAATGQPVIEVSGGYDLTRVSTEKGNQQKLIAAGFNDTPFPGLKPFYNKGFEFFNWYNSSTPAEVTERKLYLDSLLTFICPRMKSALGLPTLTYSDKISVGIEENKALSKKIILYPNPTQGELRFRLPAQVQSVALLTTDGRSLELNHKNVGVEETQINIEHLPAGIYHLRIYTDKGIATAPIQRQ